MAAEGVEDINSVIECLVNMFGDVISRDAIITVVESCGGDLNLAADAIMKITNDCSPNHNVRQTNPIPSNDVKTTGNVIPHNQDPNVIPQLPSNSYSVAMQTSIRPPQSTALKNQQPNSSPARQSLGAVPKPRTAALKPSQIQWNEQLKRIMENHNRGSRILIIMRGASGSGKTHLAQKIVEMLIGGSQVNLITHICSTDDFFMYRGKYLFNKHDLPRAHAWNQDRVKVAMQQGLSPIVVDNTNIELWEMEFYAVHGVQNGYILEVVEPNTPWARKPGLLVKKNVHDVPFVSIKRMIDNYIDNITGPSLLSYFKLKYPHGLTPPVLRSMPVFHPLYDDSKPATKTESNPIDASYHQSIQVSNVNENTDEHGKNSESNPIQDASLAQYATVVSTNILPEPAPATESVAIALEIAPSPNQKSQDHVDNTLPTNETTNSNENILNRPVYEAVRQQLEEFEKVELEWENGESWEEIQKQEAADVNEDNKSNTRSQRRTARNYAPDDELIRLTSNCEDWSQISLFMPPWKNETPPAAAVQNVVETKSSGTCMELGDFDSSNTIHKIVMGSPKNINEFHISFQREKIPDKRMLDKSTTTVEVLLTENRRCKNEEAHFIALRKLFKNVSKAALRDVFDQCMGDVNWAVEIILDGVAANQFETVNEDVVEDEEAKHEESACTCMSAYNILPNSSEQPESSEHENTASAVESTAVAVKKNNKRETKTSDASLQLKRQIEQNVFISENHYSKHCLKLRKWRHGETISDYEAGGSIQDGSQPSTSQASTSQANNQIVPYGHEHDSDDQSSDDEESSSSVSVEELEKTVNINLGKEFITELDALFGRTDMTYPETLMPKINIPISLLNEINALWMESLMHQLDEHERQTAKMIQEDAEFARALSMKESELEEVGQEPEVLDFKEIMDMEYALSLYQRDVHGWKSKEPQDLAAKMTREKLYNLFPEVPKEVLAELLMAHDNNFQATVEGLLVSTGKASILEEKNGINNFVTKKEMERHQRILEEERKALSEVEWPLLPAGEVPDMQMVQGYRDTAGRHLKNRDTNFRKASEYVRRGMLCVGGYYRQLAEFHKLKYEQTNSLAAASLMQLHASKCPDSATIDLHYLRVGEAKETLDLFLDTHISKLKENGKRLTLYFITGRGLHSNGRPRIKPAVKKRLRERGLVCSEVNPGLLSARVSGDDKLTHQVA